MDEMTANRIADFFDVGELAEYLGISVLELIFAFEDEVLERLGDINDLMEYHRG